MPTHQALEQVTRVPVGLSAYLIPHQMAEGDSIHTSGSLVKMAADGSVYSSYKLSAKKTAAGLQIGDMQFKPLQSPVSRPQESPAMQAIKPAQQSQRPIFAVQWQIAKPAPVIGSSRTAGAHTAGALTEELTKKSFRIGQSKSTAANHILRHLQELPQKAAVQLQTENVHGGRNTGPCSFKAQQSGVAATGLVRVAAQEFPSASFKHLDLAAASRVSCTDPELSGLEGILDQGLHLQPLLIQTMAPNKSELPAVSHSSSIIISGGMGDVGGAIAAGAAVGKEAGMIWLLGRTGRAPLPTALKLATCCITATSCNTATSSDLSNSQQWLSRQVLACRCLLYSTCLVAHGHSAQYAADLSLQYTLWVSPSRTVLSQPPSSLTPFAGALNWLLQIWSRQLELQSSCKPCLS